ncbi:MAG: acyltransferase family protein [Phycisphaerales bacterium]
MSQTEIKDTRRHDLDAIRSFAMLLGIFLHAGLAYTGGFWIVNDGDVSQIFAISIPAIHGFRMPLFFLLSGFFTAMLWKKRGAGGLLSHRFKRIFLPLVLIGSVILPTMWSVTGWATRVQSREIESRVEQYEGERAPSDDIWTVAGFGDMQGLLAYGEGSEFLDQQDPIYGVTPLGWTAIHDQPDAARYLLEVGADPSAVYKDQNTPMHTACFFGRDEVAKHLLEAGADLELQSAVGERPADAMRHNRQTTEFIANMLQMPIDFDEVSAGREAIRVMIEEREQVSAASEEVGEEMGLIEKLQRGTFFGNFFSHLWFLWFLCWFVVGFVVVMGVLSVLPGVRLPGVLISVPLCFVWLVPLTMVTQSHMQGGGTLPGFGPDTSVGVLPMPHVLLHYAIFFGFGAAMFLRRGAARRLGSFWYVTLPVGLLIVPFGLMFAYEPDRSAELIADDSTRAFVNNLLQVLYAWFMTFGLLGLFETLLSRERAWVRYVSDSSYWLYLAHLPLVVVGQVLLLDVEVSGLLKGTLLTLVSSVFLLGTYALFVRRTPIGLLLNGRRVARRAAATARSTAVAQ